MKKHIYSMLGLLLGAFAFSACEGDYDDWASPQTNPEPDAISIPGYTASAATTAAINLSDLTTDSVQLFTLAQASLPSGAFIENNRIVFTPQVTRPDEDLKDEVAKTINTDVNGLADAADLQDMVVAAFGKRPVAHTFVGHVYSDVNLGGDNVLIDAGIITVNLAPKAPHISTAYYIVGGPGSWSSDKSLKFQHSGKDVYEDSEFSIVIDGNPDGDCWFAIGDDEALDAIDAGDWTKLLGIVGNDSEVKSGTMDFRYNLGGDHSFCVKNARKIKITLDMMEYAFKIEVVNIADNYYLIGGPGSWSSDKSQKFSHSDMDVFEDPIFTYVFEGNGGTGDIWFAFGDDDAMDAVGAGDWTKLYGYKGDFDMTGSFERRYIMGDGVENSFHVDGKAKFYRFQINALDMTYEITPLDFTEYIYEAGVNNNWGSIAQPLYCTKQDGVYTGFFYAQDADWSGGMGAFKFTGAFNSWDDGNYGAGTCSDEGGTLVNDGGSGNLLATPGFYRADVDLGNMTYKLTRINGIGIIGPAQAGGWNDDTDMTYNFETLAWEATVELAADEFKFRANDDWAINWGGSASNLTQDGGNLKIAEAGTYFIQFFPLCETKSYCVITKQ